MPVITLKDCIFILMLPLSHRLSGKFSLPRQLVPDIGKMLEKIKNPGPSEKFPDFPRLSRANISFPDFPGFPGCVAWQPWSSRFFRSFQNFSCKKY